MFSYFILSLLLLASHCALGQRTENAQAIQLTTTLAPAAIPTSTLPAIIITIPKRPPPFLAQTLSNTRVPPIPTVQTIYDRVSASAEPTATASINYSTNNESKDRAIQVVAIIMVIAGILGIGGLAYCLCLRNLFKRKGKESEVDA
ncbi:hypothetical protein BCR33DRAFT_770198 [Rhizoclosmatium globosum]|uniref:Mid2 domain-containing protein n=1 Tax=Rhizoclosmatium globosum TaxID=329046 RepID=A0A1Y2BPQ6_9FUNG|nr:hypothetical protein BCR33DRAFT_770198 [Rhizoclosmatium globosum]|eukprot:ORY36731.1 hypothetical protein BCR33DRAFT_770198 [Rhizoclosmatium globosum]